ncbi:MAG: hypothetical protein ABIJ92_01110 [Candidatus Aenigmatarchaeota archaeon]
MGGPMNFEDVNFVSKIGFVCLLVALVQVTMLNPNHVEALSFLIIGVILLLSMLPWHIKNGFLHAVFFWASEINFRNVAVVLLVLGGSMLGMGFLPSPNLPPGTTEWQATVFRNVGGALVIVLGVIPAILLGVVRGIDRMCGVKSE